MLSNHIFTDVLQYAEAVVSKLRDPRSRPHSRIEVELEYKGGSASGRVDYLFFARFSSPRGKLTYESPQPADKPFDSNEQREIIENHVKVLRKVFYKVYYALPFSFNPESNRIDFVVSEPVSTHQILIG